MKRALGFVLVALVAGAAGAAAVKYFGGQRAVSVTTTKDSSLNLRPAAFRRGAI